MSVCHLIVYSSVYLTIIWYSQAAKPAIFGIFLKTTAWFHQINDYEWQQRNLVFFSHPRYLLPSYIDLCGLDLSYVISPEFLHELYLFEGLPMPSSRALIWFSASWNHLEKWWLRFVGRKVVLAPLIFILRAWDHHRSIPREILRLFHLLTNFLMTFREKIPVIPSASTLLKT